MLKAYKKAEFVREWKKMAAMGFQQVQRFILVKEIFCTLNEWILPGLKCIEWQYILFHCYIHWYLGAIDGTYIQIKAPTVDSESYICLKKFFALHLQVGGLITDN